MSTLNEAKQLALRSGWREVDLVDVVEVLDRMRRPVSASERVKRPGKVPYYGATGQAGWIDEPIFNEELVLLGEDAIDFLNPKVHKAYRISGPSWVNNHAHVLRAKPARVLAYFLTEALNIIDYSQFVAFGTRSKLTQGAMMGIRLNIPSLVEQKRIVDLMSSVDSYIAALQQQADASRSARSAVLSELLSAGGDDWIETTLGDVAEASWGNTTVTKKQYHDSGFTAFSASGPDGFVDWFEHDGKGVVLSAIGALCGKTWLADGRWTPIKNTIWFKSITDNCLTEYLFLLSQTPHLWPIRGQAQPFIALGDVRVVEFMLPPIAEQTRIVGVISSLDDVIRSADKAVADAKNLRSGLLSDLLSGAHEIPESYDRLLGAA